MSTLIQYLGRSQKKEKKWITTTIAGTGVISGLILFSFRSLPVFIFNQHLFTTTHLMTYSPSVCQCELSDIS